MGRVIEITGVAKDVPWDDVMTYLRDSSPEMLRMVRFGVFSDGANSQHHRFFAEFRNTVCACQAVECTIPMDSILFTTGSPHVSISRVGWIRADDGTISMSDETKTMEGTWYSFDDIDAHETRAKVLDHTITAARDDVKVIEIKGFAFNVRTALLKEYLGTRCHGLVGLGRLSVNKTYCRFFADFRDVGDARRAIERLDGCRLGLGLAYMGDKENPSLDRTLRCEMSPEANDQSSEMNKLAKWEKHTGLTPEKISASVTRQLLERDGKDPNHPSAIAARSGAMMPPSGDNRSKAFKSIYLGLNVQFIAEAGEVGIARLLQENGVSLIRDIKIPTISRQCAGYAFAKIPVSDADRLISMGQLSLPGPWSGNVLGVKSAMKEF